MKRIKSAGDYVSDITRFAEKLKSRIADFKAAMKSEGEETREAYALLRKASKGELLDEVGQKRPLSEEEIRMIKEQTVDVLRVLGFASLAILPGGTLVLILLKAFRQEDRIIPSSFKKKE